MTESCVGPLLGYRRFCASTSSPGQLILPESLKLMPLYTLGLIKSPALRSGSKGDERSAAVMRLLSCCPDQVAWACSPRMYALHSIDPAAMLATQEPDGTPVAPGRLVPAPLPVSSEKLDPEGIFLVENGAEAFVYIGPRASVRGWGSCCTVSHQVLRQPPRCALHERPRWGRTVGARCLAQWTLRGLTHRVGSAHTGGLPSRLPLAPQANPALIQLLLGSPEVEDAQVSGMVGRGMLLPSLPGSPFNQAVHR